MVSAWFKNGARSVCLLVVLAAAYQALAAPALPASGTARPDGPTVVSGVSLTLDRPRTSNAAAAPAAAASFSEDFEGAWPTAGWNISDLSSIDGGDFRWGKRTCHPRTGNSADWAVGGGTQGAAKGCSSQYPNNARSWAVYGPFDLRNAPAAHLTYHFWGHTQGGVAGCLDDYLFVGKSTDGNNFDGTSYCNNMTGGSTGNGYYEDTLDLSGELGKSQVWIAFFFASSDSGADTGVAIDDVTLELSNAASLTPTNTTTPTATRTAMPQITPTTTSIPTPGQVGGQVLRYLPFLAKPLESAPTATPTATATATPRVTPTSTTTPPATGRDGTWSGTSSQGRAVSFTVQNNALKTITVGYSVPACGVAGTGTTTFGTPLPISNNQFSITVPGYGPGALSYTISGTFNSNTTASGSLQMSYSSSFPYTPCYGSATATWTATKQ